MKTCGKCCKTLADEDFYVEKSKGLSSWCKGCTAANTRAWYSENKQKVRDWRLKKKYGISLQELQEMVAKQGGCAICGSPTPKGKKDWAVDHDHKTGRVRGILCAPCNKGLGHFEDNGQLLQKAIRYLDEFSKD